MNDEIRKTIAASALAVAKHVHDGGFAAAIVSGGSHQLSRSLLALGWGVLYPDEPIIKTFVLDSEANTLLYKYTEPDAKGVFKPDAEKFNEWMRAHIPELEQYKESPLVFVDDFMLSGVKYHEMKRYFPEYHGFDRVSFAFFAAKERLVTPPPGDDAFVGVTSDEAVIELRQMSQHIQGKEDVDEILKEVRSEAQRLRAETLAELRGIGHEMRRHTR